MTQPPNAPRPIRWWPALLILAGAAAALVVFHLLDSTFQRRNLQTLSTGVLTGLLLLLWWIGLSRAPWRIRLSVAGTVLGLVALTATLFRIRGVSGDLLPILEARWSRTASPPIPTAPAADTAVTAPMNTAAGYPQFLGPDRNASIRGITLRDDWHIQPPRILWRQPVGAGWSGFAVVGNRALTQEQRGEQETVTCYELSEGRLLWMHTDPARYATTIAGEGPRCTPTVVSHRVYTLGATGILNCLDLNTGRRLWSRQIASDANARMPEWGFASSPLAHDGLIVVSAGGQPDRSLLAYRAETGELTWSAGSAPASYSSPVVVELAGTRQILMFNSQRITSHHASTGTILWEYPWGIGQPHVAVPVVISSNHVVFSSGYGVGAERLEIQRPPGGHFSATRVWHSRRMKAKFATLVVRDGFLYGLDDGMLACLDLSDGSQRWKEGRYGHGQGLLVGQHYLLMAESGELVLLQPTPEGPGERHRFRVFHDKSWNPIALAGDLLLVRNDREAACLRLPTSGTALRQP